MSSSRRGEIAARAGAFRQAEDERRRGRWSGCNRALQRRPDCKRLQASCFRRDVTVCRLNANGFERTWLGACISTEYGGMRVHNRGRLITPGVAGSNPAPAIAKAPQPRGFSICGVSGVNAAPPPRWVARRSREPPRSGTVGDEASETCPIAGDELVESIDDDRSVKRSQHAPEGSCEPDLGEERHTSSRVAGHRNAVAEHKPPTLTARFLGHGGKEAVGFGIVERKEGQLLASVERGDDTRRPALEPSAARVEQDGSWLTRARGVVHPVTPSVLRVRRFSRRTSWSRSVRAR